MIVTVLGNSPLNIGAASAAELALAGHEVRVALGEWPEAIEVVGRGAARLHLMESGDALRGVDLVVVDIPPALLLERLRPYLTALTGAGAVHVNSHGYWPALRLAHAMRGAGLSGFCVTDAGAPTHAAALDGNRLTPHARRTGLRVAAAPMERLAAALPLIRTLAPDATAASDPLETGLEGINLAVHPALSLANLGWFDRAAAAGEQVRFYHEGNVASAAAIAAALDAERLAIGAAWGVAPRTLPALLRDLYNARGDGAAEAIATCPFYAGLAPQDPALWRRWLAQDIPYALCPALALAAARGVAAPVMAGLAAVLDTVLGGTSPGLDLDDMGIMP
jgi:opine dehydrogenase